MSTKTQQLQIRVTPAQKAALKRRAAQAGTDVSSYVLERVLPPTRDRFERLIDALGAASAAASDHRWVLAELNDFLADLTPGELAEATAECDLRRLSPFLQNYASAMVEQACVRAGVGPPAWVADGPALAEPYFATDLASLRPHLLRESPVPFKRRNLFVDATVGDRV